MVEKQLNWPQQYCPTNELKPHLSISSQYIRKGLWESFPYSVQEAVFMSSRINQINTWEKKISVRSIQQLLAEQIPKLGTNEEVLELRSCESFRGLLPHAYPIVMFFHGHSLLIAVFSVFSVVSHKAKTHQRKKQWTQHHPSVNLPPKNPTKKSITPRLFSFY